MDAVSVRYIDDAEACLEKRVELSEGLATWPPRKFV